MTDQPQQNNKTLTYIIIGLFVFIIILLMARQCDRNKGGNGLPVGVISTDTVVKIKLVTRVKVDTVYRVVYRDVKPKPVPAPVYVDKRDSSVRQYVDSFNTPELTMYYEAKTRGILTDFKPSFRLKIPTITIKRDSIFTNTTTITTVKQKTALYGGLTVGFNAKYLRPEAGVNLTVVTRKGLSLGYSYLIFSNTHLATVQYRLFPKR